MNARAKLRGLKYYHATGNNVINLATGDNIIDAVSCRGIFTRPSVERFSRPFTRKEKIRAEERERGRCGKILSENLAEISCSDKLKIPI